MKPRSRSFRRSPCESCASLLVLIGLAFAADQPTTKESPRMDTPASAPSPQRSKVDFAWSFGTPHRLTAALPDSGRKTLLDLQPGWLKLSWTYEDLTTYPLAAFLTPPTQWEIHVEPLVDGARLAKSTWQRAEGWLPVLDNRYTDDRGEMSLQVAGGESAMILRVEVRNTSTQEHTYTLRSTCPGGWAGYNPAWVDPAWSRDVLLAGWKDRADRVIVLAVGGQMEHHKTAVGQTWRLKPGQSQVAWLVRPYEAYEADLPALRKQDWAGQFEAGKRTWRDLMARTTRMEIPDQGVRNAFQACLADLFVMREPVAGGYVAATPGTEVYRQSNPVEAGIVAVAINQVGLHAESAQGFRMCLELQGDDGNWNDPKGWGHLIWCCAGFKAWATIEHYKLTGDRAYLEAVYPRMLASSRWQETQRVKMRVMDGPAKSPTYGLMPRGMGDAGLMDGDDHYGVFLPHNIWAVYADQVAVEVAGILGKAGDLPELTRIYQAGKADLLEALNRGAIQEAGYRWIPAVSGKTCGSRWGALNAAFPCRLLPADHELITGTIRQNGIADEPRRHPRPHRLDGQRHVGGHHAGQPGRGAAPARSGRRGGQVHPGHAEPRHAAVHLVRGAGPAGRHEQMQRRPPAPLDPGGRRANAPRRDGRGRRPDAPPGRRRGPPMARRRRGRGKRPDPFRRGQLPPPTRPRRQARPRHGHAAQGPRAQGADRPCPPAWRGQGEDGHGRRHRRRRVGPLGRPAWNHYLRGDGGVGRAVRRPPKRCGQNAGTGPMPVSAERASPWPSTRSYAIEVAVGHASCHCRLCFAFHLGSVQGNLEARCGCAQKQARSSAGPRRMGRGKSGGSAREAAGGTPLRPSGGAAFTRVTRRVAVPRLASWPAVRQEDSAGHLRSAACPLLGPSA